MSTIVRLFQHGRADKARFAELVRPHIAIMHRMAWQWTGSEEDAEDLVQDVLTTLVSRVPEMSRIDHLRPWLVKVAYHRYVDIYRRKKRVQFDEFDESDPEAAMAYGDDFVKLQERDAIRQAMRTLSDDQRDTLIMHDLQGYTEEETARKLNISTGTVKSRLHRARRKFREAMMPGTFSRA